MTSDNTWTDEFAFGDSGGYGRWEWNPQGMNTVIYKLLSSIEYAYAKNNDGLVTVLDMEEVDLQYFEPVYLSGIEKPFNPYGDLIPVVGLFKINWDAYNAANSKR
jgi:hypothetical protein